MAKSSFDIVPNFRVALHSQNTNKQPAVYRSSRLDSLSNEKVSLLSSHYNIRTILDLRSDREVKMGPRCMLNRVYTPQTIKPKTAQKTFKSHHKMTNINDTTQNPLLGSRNRFILSLIGGPAFFGLVKELPNYCWRFFAILCLLSDLVCRTALLTRYIMPKILNKMGLKQFNLFLLEHSKEQIVTAMQVFTDSSRFPILVNCAQGKDRTGLIVALLQLLCDFGHSDIINHYSLSYDLLKDSEILSDICTKFYLNESWTQSNAETMQHIIDYIIENYSSVNNYLEQCGLSEGDQKLIKDNINNFQSDTYEEERREERREVGGENEDVAASDDIRLHLLNPREEQNNSHVIVIPCDPDALAVTELRENEAVTEEDMAEANEQEIQHKKDISLIDNCCLAKSDKVKLIIKDGK